MGDYRKLRVWKDAVDFAVACYEATSRFPSAERFGLTSQMRRSAASIAANLAEGSGRKSDREFARFTRIAGGSANETETFLILAGRLGYLPDETAAQLCAAIGSIKRQLAGLERTLR
ncbi:MAG: four helix bundle protein [Acidimicrobiia bacterium]|nr:four helix bundle protein [Acidimicrobiia bacterium]MBT8192543.1 four helix bundle protein [Acidimicrobiia bacterium]MBT8247965.1 four helix bundle protein [Acidimicrobiia bacterium]NNF89191.1 four helix bundle protein [Acidimicrobiia bacterium]NNJ47825.1 four helix bundle protein [Acidimicrobiia bacterium]